METYKVGDVITEDIVNPASGEIIAETGDIVTEERVSLINCVLEDIVRYQNTKSH